MTYEDFLGRVRERALLPGNEQTERLIRALGGALADRVEQGALEPVRERLPVEVAAYFRGSESADPFQLDALFRRVSAETGADIPATVQHCQAVMSVVTEAAGEDAMRRLREQLPVSWNRLFPTGAYYEPPRPRTT